MLRGTITAPYLLETTLLPLSGITRQAFQSTSFPGSLLEKQWKLGSRFSRPLSCVFLSLLLKELKNEKEIGAVIRNRIQKRKELMKEAEKPGET